MRVSRIPIPTPFPVGPTNVYVIEDEQIALVDAGPKTDENAEALESGLRRAGYDLGDIDFLIITHAHEDHYGLARFVKDRSSAQVWAHPAAAPTLANREREHHARAEGGQSRLFKSVGAPNELTSANRPAANAVRRLGEQVEVDRFLEEGDVLQIGGTSLQVMHTPGHSPSAICLYSEREKAIFAGDQLLQNSSTNAMIDGSLYPGAKRSRTLANYLASLRRLRGMDLDILYPGHGETVTDHRSLIERRMRSCERRKGEILDLLGNQEMTPYQLARTMFPQAVDIDVFLSISEVVGHLDLLEEDGMVSWRHEDDVIHYRRVERAPVGER